MKQRSVLLLFVFVFWTMFFVIARGIFLVYFAEAGQGLGFVAIMQIFGHGILMDFSAAAYATIFTGVLLALLYFKTGIQLWPLWIAAHVLFLIVASATIVYDLALYPAWGYRLDVRALTGMDWQSAFGDTRHGLILLAVFLLLITVSVFISVRLFWPRFYVLRATSLATLPVIAAFTAMLMIPMRGSLGVVSMNASFGYSHATHAFANHAGVNVAWNFMNSLRWGASGMSADNGKLVSSGQAWVTLRDSASAFVHHPKPNIILILLDRLPAELVGALGGRADATPRFNALASEGILFDEFYSNSDRPDKGLTAILNGYPSQPGISLMSDARRAQGLPYLNKVFSDAGYSTGFTSGGWPNYNNLRAYLFSAGFDSVTHAGHFAGERRSGTWGVPDEFVFERLSEEIFHERQPFFRVMVTQGTRKPYDVPAGSTESTRDPEMKFLNAMRYTDRSLGDFIESAKKTLWWKNTLIIVTAIQGSASLEDEADLTPASFRIPMLWLGGALTKQDTVIHTLGNQTDICNTLLAQVSSSSDKFAFSRNMFGVMNEQLAMFVYDKGFGVVKTYGAGIFEKNNGKVIYAERVNEREAEQARELLKAVRSDYASR